MRAATAGVATLGASGAHAGQSHKTEQPSEPVDVTLLDGVDAMLALLDHPEALPTVFHDVGPLRTGAGHPELVRSALKSLLMLGVFRDLSDEELATPEIQQRLWEVVPDIEWSIERMARMLSDLQPAARVEVQERLRRDRDLPMRLCAALEANVPREAVSLSRRIQWRGVATDLAFRLERQPAGLVIDELVEKYRRTAAAYPADPRALEFAKTAAAERASGRHVAERRKRDRSSVCGCLPWACRDTVDGWGDTVSGWKRNNLQTVGLVLCGIGVALPLAGCGLSFALPFPGALIGMGAITVGALLLVAGLIVLGVGIVLMLWDGSNDSESKEDDVSTGTATAAPQRY